MLRIGITEAGDAGRHLEWTAAMDSDHAAILITKAPTGEFLEAVKRFRARVMLHVTVTGYGGSLIEPGAPPATWSRQQYDQAAAILSPEQVVLRVDPIIPTRSGLVTALSVLRLFEDSVARRVRYSFLDMYPHVAARFHAAGVPHPYEGRFSPTPAQIAEAQSHLAPWRASYQFESCAERGPTRSGVCPPGMGGHSGSTRGPCAGPLGSGRAVSVRRTRSNSYVLGPVASTGPSTATGVTRRASVRNRSRHVVRTAPTCGAGGTLSAGGFWPVGSLRPCKARGR